MKHAYLILAHGQWELLQTLVSTIDDERNDIYVHIDAKVKKMPELSVTHSVLTLIDDRVDVRWGDVSQIEAEYALFEKAFASGKDYGYYHILSGVDLPIKSQDYIHDYFDRHSGEEFIGYSELSLSPLSVKKVMRWHLFPRSFKSESVFVKGLRFAFLKLQTLFGVYRNQGMDFKKGSNWVSITPALVKILIERKSWTMNTFSHTFCADEMFVQTICWNSPLRNKIHDTGSDAEGCLRAICWIDGCLYDWGAGDFEALKSSEALFARKFNLSDRGFIRKVVGLSLPSRDNHGSGPAISVIMPVHNAEGTLKKSLESLKTQTMRDFEVVFIDDGSTDGSYSILNDFVRESDIRAAIIRLEHNGGVAAARNMGLDAAQGEFIAWLDADDTLLPGALETMLDFALPLIPGSPADIVGFDWMLGFEKNSRYMRQADWESPDEAAGALCGGTARWNLWLFLLNREFAERSALRFTPGADMGEDMAFMLSAFASAGKAVQIHEALYSYNAGSGTSISRKLSPARRNEIETNLKQVENLVPDINALKLYLKRPLLVSGNREDFDLWQSWFSEANRYGVSCKNLPFRTRALQWMAMKKLWAGVLFYYIFVYKLVYGVIFR